MIYMWWMLSHRSHKPPDRPDDGNKIVGGVENSNGVGALGVI